uniref:FXYD domain-containing ion transport regulator n=1 Tax=Suricata suricatta TaxID=37032 RepID=A0A673V071_SURSU
MATPTQAPTKVPQEPDPFHYDYDTVQTVGMTLATILFLLGILIIISKKVKCRKADSRSESPTCKSCKSELPSSGEGEGGVVWGAGEVGAKRGRGAALDVPWMMPRRRDVATSVQVGPRRLEVNPWRVSGRGNVLESPHAPQKRVQRPEAARVNRFPRGESHASVRRGAPSGEGLLRSGLERGGRETEYFPDFAVQVEDRG